MGARENMGREMYRRRGRKLPGIRVLKGQKAGEIWVYRVYKVYMRIQGIQGIQGIYGYTGYTGYTEVYRVYRVYMGIQGIQGIQNTGYTTGNPGSVIVPQYHSTVPVKLQCLYGVKIPSKNF